ncbi:MAG: helix-turn-helix domain-containing protein, partial [Pseudobdellovibrionaceae bacterium]
MNEKSMGNRIRRLREKKAWTQEHLAGAASVSVRTVQRAEEGTLSAETLTAIAGALDVEVKTITEVAVSASHIPVITPILYYEKVATLDWLARAFGFEILEKHTNPDGSIMHAEIKIA